MYEYAACAYAYNCMLIVVVLRPYLLLRGEHTLTRTVASDNDVVHRVCGSVWNGNNMSA